MDGLTVKPALSKYLIIDSGGFIKNVPLQEFGQNLITMREVVDEIRDKDTKQRIRSLPFELQFLEPDVEAIQKVTEFSKKTGDYASLSAVDIKVMALTYMLEIRHVGTEHIKLEPTVARTIEFYKPGGDQGSNSKVPVGFFTPQGYDEEIAENNENETAAEEQMDQVEDAEEEESGSSEEEEDDDDDGWITPSNVKAKKLEMLGAGQEEDNEPREVVVACLTTDFAMQNVLKQLGLHVLSADGILIKQTKTWILRCYACFTTTPRMEKQFCPKCGNKTLKRVSVTLNADGTQQIHISTRKPLSTRGKKFSLPKPQGGKYAVNPILAPDQRIPQQKKSSLAHAKTNALSDDYIAGNAPFVKRDVTSKSAMLGIGSTHGHYWAKKNPNAVGRKTGNRKKKD